MIAVIIVVVLVVVLVLIFIGVNNSMIGARNRVDEAWSGIDVQLKRRHDLVPNLVETVKGYATHERETFQKVTEARAEAMKAQGPAQAGAAEGQLSAVLGDLRAIAENYPELRATENFQQLSRNLSELEDEIQAARRIYNSNVQAYNTKIQVFPNSMIANMRELRGEGVLRDHRRGGPRAGPGQLQLAGRRRAGRPPGLVPPKRGAGIESPQQGVLIGACDLTTTKALPGTVLRRLRSPSFHRTERAPVMNQLAPVPPLSALMIP